MPFRSIPIAAIAVCCLLAPADAAPHEPLASFRPAPEAVATATDVSAYRQYARAQADTLVAMIRALARAIRHGDLDTAQVTYAPAHRYLALIAPMTRAMPALDKSMDARADAYAAKEADPDFSGFHRIEYGLFAKRSVANLSVVADRLESDALALRDRLALVDVTPGALLDATIANLEDVAAKSLSGEEERYARTDLWDFEANVEGARQVVALLQPRHAETLASARVHLARIDALLDTHKDGCGYKGYHELGRDDRMALNAPIAALAKDLATLRGTPATD